MTHRTRIGLLSFGHFVDDIMQGAVPGLVPFLVASRHWPYARAAALVFFMNIASSVVQPLMGHFADRISIRWFIPVGVLMAGTGVALCGWSTSYSAILVAVAISGIGVATFHPQSAQLVRQFGGKRAASSMAVFAIGGNAGFAAGPILIAFIVTTVGMHGTLILIVPTIVAVIALWRVKPNGDAASLNGFDSPENNHSHWAGFSVLAAVITFRAISFHGLASFLPLFWAEHFHQSIRSGSAALSGMLAIGTLATLAGGWMGDRIDKRHVARYALIFTPPLLAVVLMTGSLHLAIAALLLLGLAMYAPFSIFVVLGQEYLPSRTGFASGLTIGLTVTVGAVAAPLLGLLADHYGLKTMLLCLVVTLLTAALLTWALPAPAAEGKRKVTAAIVPSA